MQSCVIARQFTRPDELSNIRESAIIEARQLLGTDKISITHVSDLEDSTHVQDGIAYPHQTVHFTFTKDEK